MTSRSRLAAVADPVVRSAAQLAMFQRAASDAAYAASRGITQELAQAHCDAHAAAGQPKLPERVEGKPPKPQRSPTSIIARRFLTSRRAD
jgi:hypothetical protein